MDLGGDRVEKSIKTLTAEIAKNAGKIRVYRIPLGPNFSLQIIGSCLRFENTLFLLSYLVHSEPPKPWRRALMVSFVDLS
jgi:hypothetical protein